MQLFYVAEPMFEQLQARGGPEAAMAMGGLVGGLLGGCIGLITRRCFGIHDAPARGGGIQRHATYTKSMCPGHQRRWIPGRRPKRAIPTSPREPR